MGVMCCAQDVTKIFAFRFFATKSTHFFPFSIFSSKDFVVSKQVNIFAIVSPMSTKTMTKMLADTSKNIEKVKCLHSFISSSNL